MNTKIGIIGAMDIEVNMLKSQLLNTTVTEKAGVTFIEGSLNGKNVVIAKSGVGKVNAALCTQLMITVFNATCIINTGIAGAAAHGLKVQDIVLSTDAVYHDMNVVEFGYKITEIPGMKCSCFPADTKMIDAAQKAFDSLKEKEGHKLIKGRIASGDVFVASKELKNTIIQNCNPACVEMEGAAIAHACYVNQIPYLIIRCMSDMADDNGEESYSFNEEAAAVLSAALVKKTIELL